MAFTVEDFSDLLQLLEQHPEWRAELRRHVLDAELLEMPALVRQLVEAQVRTEQGLDRLTEQVADLAEAQVRTEQRLGQLADRVDRLTEQVAALTTQTQGLANDVSSVKGDMFELRVRSHAASYSGHLARRLRVLDNTFLADLLDDAVDEGRLNGKDRDDVLRADAVLSGRRRDDQVEVYLAVEVSVGVGLDDVQRASEQAALLAKLGRPVMPVVAGQFSSPEADYFARRNGVWQVLAGRRVSPEA